MEFIYLDEQFAPPGRPSYTAALGFQLHDSKLHELRALVYGGLKELLRPSQQAIWRLPDLHGSGFLSEEQVDDAVKIAGYRLLLESVRACEGYAFRVGYFDESLEAYKFESTAQKLAWVLSSTHIAFNQTSFQSRYMLISEFDLQSLRAGLLAQDKELSTYYQAPSSAISIDLAKFMGHVYAPKSHFGCQLADCLGYLCLKADQPCEGFSQKLSDLRSEFNDLYLADRIIYMNDESRSEIRA